MEAGFSRAPSRACDGSFAVGMDIPAAFDRRAAQECRLRMVNCGVAAGHPPPLTRRVYMPDQWDYSRPERRERPMPPVLTLMLCGLSVLLTAADLLSQGDRTSQDTPLYRIAHMAAPSVTAVWDGHYAALLTSVFIHANLIHLGFNMIWLFRLGSVLEETLNPLYYALFIVASAVISSGAEVAASSTTGVGLSGVV